MLWVAALQQMHLWFIHQAFAQHSFQATGCLISWKQWSVLSAEFCCNKITIGGTWNWKSHSSGYRLSFSFGLEIFEVHSCKEDVIVSSWCIIPSNSSYGLQDVKRDIRTFALSFVSDQSAQSAQADLKRHLIQMYFMHVFCLQQVYFSTKENAVVKCFLGLACVDYAGWSDRSLRKCPIVPFCVLQAISLCIHSMHFVVQPTKPWDNMTLWHAKDFPYPGCWYESILLAYTLNSLFMKLDSSTLLLRILSCFFHVYTVNIYFIHC